MSSIKFRLLFSLSTIFTIQSAGFQGNTPVNVAEIISTLGYPSIPKSVLSGPDSGLRNPNSIAPTQLARSQDWALASIGFFRVFNPIHQPIQTETLPCSKSVVVAVIDTGIDYTHTDLMDSLWVNSMETGPWTQPTGYPTSCRDLSCNGIDDDHNGYVDDVIGWDYVHKIPTPFDSIGHGTHIAGIIASNGKTSVKGVCSGVSIMTLKYYDPSSSGSSNLSNLVQAIQYANLNGADIINFSGGGIEPSEIELAILRSSRELGVLLVTAAGNQGRSNDLFGSYPANYPLDNILSVASVDSKNELLPSSNFGAKVQLAAPGDEILSTFPMGGTGRLTGTSQATAFVTGAAAFLMSQLKSHTSNDYIKIKSWLTRSAKPATFAKKNATISSGLLSLPDAYRLLRNEEAKRPR